MRRTASDIAQLFAASGLAEYWPDFRDKLRPCIRLTYSVVDEATVPVGASRLGGRPDLPVATEWPEFEGRPLSFLAQLNMADLPASEVRDLLPAYGLLSFFHSADNDDYQHAPHRVLFSEAPASELARKPQPADWPAGEAVYKTGKLGFTNEQSLPGGESEYVGSVFAAKEQPDQPNLRMSYWELAEPDNSVETTNKLFGYAARNNDQLEILCECLSSGRDPATWRAFGEQLSMQEKTNLTDKWLLLLQLDSNTDLGMGFGDLDYFYFWITREDLARQDFAKCVAFSYH